MTKKQKNTGLCLTILTHILAIGFYFKYLYTPSDKRFEAMSEEPLNVQLGWLLMYIGIFIVSLSLYIDKKSN
jgi:hypothetical protein